MKLLVPMSVLILSAVSIRAQSQVVDVRNQNFKVAIENGSSSIRYDLARCAENWKFYPERRAKYDELVANANFAEAPMIGLQIGNSGFGRYDFIFVNGKRIESSFPNKISASSRKLVELNKILSKIDATDLVEESSPKQEDGDCYFLIGNDGKDVRHMAFYGTPGSTKTGLLIRKMLELVR